MVNPCLITIKRWYKKIRMEAIFQIKTVWIFGGWWNPMWMEHQCYRYEWIPQAQMHFLATAGAVQAAHQARPKDTYYSRQSFYFKCKLLGFEGNTETNWKCSVGSFVGWCVNERWKIRSLPLIEHGLFESMLAWFSQVLRQKKSHVCCHVMSVGLPMLSWLVLSYLSKYLLSI